jgi:hypothetical protein
LHFMGHSLKLLVYIHALALLLEPWILMTHFRFISVQPDSLYLFHNLPQPATIHSPVWNWSVILCFADHASWYNSG